MRMSIADNISRIREQMETAARRVLRSSDGIFLLAVTKTVSEDRICEAYEAGIRVFGENRVQEFGTKYDRLRDLTGAHWHMIGHLQSNKAAQAVKLFNAVDSVDSVRIARKLNAAAEQNGKKVPVLIEINIGGEVGKHGVPANSRELDELLAAASSLSSLEFCGLMAVPPYNDDPEGLRPYFRQMRILFEGVASRRWPGVTMQVLSMGMSHDFEVAIEEGSTCIRVGTRIFGERKLTRSND
jgi:PLP dependent protein